MRRAILAMVVLSALPAAAQDPNYPAQAIGAELWACMNGKVQASATLLVAQARIVELERQLAAVKPVAPESP